MKLRRPRHLVGEIVAALVTLALMGCLLEQRYADYQTPLDSVLGPLQTAAETTLLIVGNSHVGALGSLPLRGDDRVYNASVGGQDLYRSYLLLRNYVPRLPHLREVIVSSCRPTTTRSATTFPCSIRTGKIVSTTPTPVGCTTTVRCNGFSRSRRSSDQSVT